MILPPYEKLPKLLKQPEVCKYYSLLKKRSKWIFIKRVFDLVLSMFMLAIAFPFMGIISLVICLSSKGGAVFRQRRVTQFGQIFTIYKFRTMYSGTGDPSCLCGKISPVGSFLRHSRLDELPQLVNIMRGEMSFVGARPEIPSFVTSYSPEMLATLLLPAGVTSRASIAFKNEENMLPHENRDEYYIRHILPSKMEYNLHYIKCFSLWEDIKILLATGFAVFRR